MKWFLPIFFLAIAVPAGAVSWYDPTGGQDIRIVVGNLIRYVLGLTGVAVLLAFLYAGFTWMTSAGSPDKTKKAKDLLIYTTIGMIVIFASYALANFVLSQLAMAARIQ